MPFPQPQIVPLIFEGLDTFTDPKRGVVTKLDLLENAYVSTPFKLQKRNGYTNQTKNIQGGGSLAAGAKLTPYRDELLMTDGAKLFTKAALGANWVARAKMPSGSLIQERLTGDTIANDRLNVAGQTVGGLLLYCWQKRSINTVNWYLVETATGAMRASGNFTGSIPRVVTLSGFLFLASLNTSNGRIEVRKVDPASPSTMGSPTTVDTIAGMETYDMAADTGNTKLLFAYSNTADQCHLRSVNPTTLAVSADAPFSWHTSAVIATSITWLLHDYADGKAYLSLNNASFGRVWDITTSTLAAGTFTDVGSGGATTGYVVSGANAFTLFREVLGASPDLNVIRGFTSAGAVNFDLARGASLGGRVFKQGSRYYLPVVYEDTTQRSRVLLEYEHATNGADGGGTVFVGFLGSQDDGGVSAGVPADTTVQWLSDSVNYGSGAWGLLSHYSFDLGAHFGVQNHRVTFTEAGLSPPENFVDLKYFPGLQLNAYDGESLVESGFYLKPQAPSLTTAGGGSKGGGTYQVLLVYSWTDARGRVWRSAPGPAASISTGASSFISVTCKTLRMTNKAAKFNLNTTVPAVNIEVYSSLVNGATMYLETTVANDVTADTATAVQINLSDAVLQTRELLYTTGGVLKNDPIPGPRLLKVFGGRMFACVSNGDIWHTKDAAEGESAAWSVTRFRIPIDTSTGQVTALMDMDQQFLIGQRNGVFVLGGGDPSDTGTNPFASPTRINTTIGPLDQVTVCRLPGGIAYNTPRGIHQLTRGLDSQFIGQNVQRYTLADTLTGAVVMDGVNQARWTTSNGDLLVYDHALGFWSVGTGLAAVATCLYQNVHAILASDGTVKLETAGTFNDSGTAIVMKLRTAWISLGGIAGYKRLWEILAIGEYKGTHELALALSYNFSTFTNETLTASPGAGTYNTTIEGGYTWAAQPKQQLCTSVQITLNDVLSGSGSEGFQLSALALLVGVLGGNTFPGARVISG